VETVKFTRSRAVDACITIQFWFYKCLSANLLCLFHSPPETSRLTHTALGIDPCCQDLIRILHRFRLISLAIWCKGDCSISLYCAIVSFNMNYLASSGRMTPAAWRGYPRGLVHHYPG
jgi:hypothetical protein